MKRKVICLSKGHPGDNLFHFSLFHLYLKKTKIVFIISVHSFILDMLGQSHNIENGSYFKKLF